MVELNDIFIEHMERHPEVSFEHLYAAAAQITLPWSLSRQSTAFDVDLFPHFWGESQLVPADEISFHRKVEFCYRLKTDPFPYRIKRIKRGVLTSHFRICLGQKPNGCIYPVTAYWYNCKLRVERHPASWIRQAYVYDPSYFEGKPFITTIAQLLQGKQLRAA